MKRLKRITAMILALVVALTIVPVVQAEAATDSYPTKFRLYSWGASEDTFVIQVTDHHTYIDNVKSKDKNLIAGLTDYYYYSYGTDADNYTLSFLAKKQGTYDITYDVMKDKKKVKTVKAKVYVYPSPISVQLSGTKNNYYYGNKTSANLKVKAQKGNKITKVEVGTYKTKTRKQNTEWSKDTHVDSERVYKRVKSSSKIKLGTTGSYYKSSSSSANYSYKYLWSDLMSETFIRVTYKDEYTKRNEQVEYYYRGLAK